MTHSITYLPAVADRLQTGPVKVGSENYPGIYIRGDDALSYANVLRRIDEWPLADLHEPLQELIALLRSCEVKRK